MNPTLFGAGGDRELELSDWIKVMSEAAAKPLTLV